MMSTALYRSFRALLVLLSLMCFSPPLLLAAVDLGAPLPIDPAIHRGTLDNGVTYWIRSHATPPGKIAFWMHVSTGSVNEKDGQEGIAHYLEHLAFNGTRHFAPGELVKYFESIGLRFGQHQNASTGFNQTTYTLALPNTQPGTIDKGLLYLADVAFGMLLLPEEIDRERGIILEEKRARKGVWQRLTDKLLPAILPGSRVARRLPIGRETTIGRLQRDDFLDYYATWYHPANITILAVGDVPVETIKAAIATHFSHRQVSAPPPKDLDYGITPYTTQRAIVLSDPELTTATVEVLAISPRQPVKTVGAFRQRLLKRLGTWIVNRRLQQLIQEGKAPYQRARVSATSLFGVATQVSAEATSEPAAWRESFTSLLVEVQRARQYGFTGQEVADVKTASLAAAEHAEQTESTRNAGALLASMHRARTATQWPRSAAQTLQLLRQLLPGVTAHEVAATFADQFAPGPKAAIVLLPDQSDLPIPSREDVLALVHTVRVRTVEPWQSTDRPTTLLDQLPTPGGIAERTHYAPLGITHVTFDNNVRLHYRFMDFKKDHVTVTMTLPGGVIRETAANRGITAVAALPLLSPATSRFSSTALRDFMTGKKVGVAGSVTADAIVLRVAGTPEALEEGLQLAHVLLRDATIEPARVALWKQRKLQALAAQRTRVGARTHEAARRVLSGDDPRLRPLTPVQVETRAQALPPAQAWLNNILRTAPMEVAIVGDMPEARALALAATYLGSLPKRPLSDPSVEALRHVAGFTGPREQRIEVETITPRAQPILMWRSAPWEDVHGRRLMHIAGRILERRIRQEIRENRGLTYSIATYARPSKIYPLMSALYVQFTTDPDTADEAVHLARSVVQTFAAEGPTDTEMETVRKQLLNAVETMLKEPHFWVGLLKDLDYHDTKLEDVNGLLGKLLAYSKDDIAAAIKRTVQPERFAVVIGQPTAACIAQQAECGVGK